MAVVVLPDPRRAMRRIIAERSEYAGFVAGERLERRFRGVIELLERHDLGSSRKWAPPQYRFVPVDQYHLIWRFDEHRPNTRIVVKITFQSANPARIARGLRQEDG